MHRLKTDLCRALAIVGLLVAAGMTSSDVIVASTKNAAEFLRLQDAGTIAEGKRADRAAGQTAAVHVPRDTVDAALAKGGVLVTAPQVQVAGFHRGAPGVLETQSGTSILYVTEGEGTLAAAGMRAQRLTKGDVLVVPAGTAQAFTAVSSPISYLRITVPVMAKGAKAEIVYVDHDTVAAATKKAAPLADAPNLRVSGGFRPFASTEKSPVAEIHTNEADFFYIVDGRATQVLGGTMIDGKETGPGQIRGPRTEGGRTYHVAAGDIMWVPANTPHWFPEIPEALGYLLVKISW